MSKKFVAKNIKLSLEFDRYIANHPKIIAKIPHGAYIVMTVKGDKAFNQNSRKLVEKSPAKKVIEAMKEGTKWTFQPLAT